MTDRLNEHWVIIAGSRSFNNYDLLKQIVNETLDEYPRRSFPGEKIVIVSGGQRSIDYKTNKYYGADYLGEKYSKEVLGQEPIVYKANWNAYGKRAGMLRNEEMASASDGLIAFWDGSSPGTKNMIKLADDYRLWKVVYNFKENKYVTL